eukprot:5280735-Prymnesium_polylepis.1
MGDVLRRHRLHHTNGPALHLLAQLLHVHAPPVDPLGGARADGRREQRHPQRVGAARPQLEREALVADERRPQKEVADVHALRRADHRREQRRERVEQRPHQRVIERHRRAALCVEDVVRLHVDALAQFHIGVEEVVRVLDRVEPREVYAVERAVGHRQQVLQHLDALQLERALQRLPVRRREAFRQLLHLLDDRQKDVEPVPADRQLQRATQPVAVLQL